MLTIKIPPETGVGVDNGWWLQTSKEYGAYHQFHPSSVIWEGMIVARGLDREDTQAPGEYGRSVLLYPSLRLEETGKAVRRLPMNEPLRMLAWVALMISRMKG
jgi:hypothetical protein